MTLYNCGSIFVGVAILLAGHAVFADNPPAAKPAGGLSATIVATKNTYALDPTQSGAAFRDKLAAIQRDNKPAPTPPSIDLTMHITNTGDQPVTLSIGGDESRITLKLEGPGAVTIPNTVPMTMDFRAGTPVTIGPGKSHDIPIKSLSFGSRGISDCAYWTEPGDYTLAATLTAAHGDEQLSVTSDPAKLKVVKAGR